MDGKELWNGIYLKLQFFVKILFLSLLGFLGNVKQ